MNVLGSFRTHELGRGALGSGQRLAVTREVMGRAAVIEWYRRSGAGGY